jgi:hypothetical protein
MNNFTQNFKRPLFIFSIALLSMMCHEAYAQGGPPHHPKKKKPKVENTTEAVETISVFPNPVVKYAEIETVVEEEEEMTGCNGGGSAITTSKNAEEYSLYISDLEGVLYLEQTISSETEGNVMLDLGDLKNGVYVLKKIKGEQVSFVRFSIEH